MTTTAVRHAGAVRICAAVAALLATVAAADAQRQADLDWRVRPLGGETVSIERFKGEVLFINLWATWCEPCVAELGSIERLRDSLDDVQGLRFLLVAPQRERELERFVRRHSLSVPVFREVQRMPASFGLRALPTTYIVDRSGNVVLVHRGAADWDTAAVRRLLQTLAASDGSD